MCDTRGWIREAQPTAEDCMAGGLCGGLSFQLLFVDNPFSVAIKYLVMKVMEQVFTYNGASMERMLHCSTGVIGHCPSQHACLAILEMSIPIEKQ